MKRAKKAWLVIDAEGCSVGEALAGVSWPAVYLTRAGARKARTGGERVVPCTITWEDGKKRKGQPTR